MGESVQYAEYSAVGCKNPDPNDGHSGKSHHKNNQ
jgi:hypothetical protein